VFASFLLTGGALGDRFRVKARLCAAHSDGARKANLHRTAWWSWQVSNQQPSDYAWRWMSRFAEHTASMRESQHLMLTRPCDRRIEQAGDTDSARQPTTDSGLDEAWREEG
jgi:hypothetical protein